MLLVTVPPDNSLLGSLSPYIGFYMRYFVFNYQVFEISPGRFVSDFL